jgi:protein gp37
MDDYVQRDRGQQYMLGPDEPGVHGRIQSERVSGRVLERKGGNMQKKKKKKKGDWSEESVNPIQGLCQYACPYCYARRMYTRFKWNKTVRLALPAFDSLPKKPSRVFVCSTHDVMGPWIPDKWIWSIIEECRVRAQHTFYFLTKNPQRYASFVWPENCWLGATAEDGQKADQRCYELSRVDCAKRFWSFEPLLGPIVPKFQYLPDWLIIGGLTPKPSHATAWIDSICAQADMAHVPVFIKDNARYPRRRRKFPASMKRIRPELF